MLEVLEEDICNTWSENRFLKELLKRIPLMKKKYWNGALGVYRFYQLPVLIIFFLQVDEVVSTKFSSLAACYHAIPVITDPNPLLP